MEKDNGIFNFSKADIENIWCNSLESCEGIRPTPTMPKNPYNGKKFNSYELKLMYDFLLRSSRKINPEDSCYTKTTYLDIIPETLRLFRYSHFDLKIFCYNNAIYLKYCACRNHIKGLDNKELSLDIFTAFKIFNITKPPNPHYINSYLEVYRNSIENIMVEFTYYYHYFELDDILEGILSQDTPEVGGIYHYIQSLIEKFKNITREIIVIGYSNRTIIKGKRFRKTTLAVVDNNPDNIFIFKACEDESRSISKTIRKEKIKNRLTNKKSKEGNKRKKSKNYKGININIPKFDPNTFIFLSDKSVEREGECNGSTYKSDSDSDSDFSDKSIFLITHGNILIKRD